MEILLFAGVGMVVAMVVLARLFVPEAPTANTYREFMFRGVIQSLPPNGKLIGDWRIGGRIVYIGAETMIDETNGAVHTGKRVLVDGLKQKGGVIVARRIDTRAARGAGKSPGT